MFASRIVALLVVVALTPASVAGQVPAAAPGRFPPPPTGEEATDSARKAWLHEYGIRTVGRVVDVWYSPGTLSPQHAKALVDSLDVGVDGLLKFIGGRQSWQRITDQKVRFYFPADRFIAHMSGPNDTLDAAAAMISAARVQVGPAPYLHEAMHSLLLPASPFFPWEYPDSTARNRLWPIWPQWLVEGFAEFAAHEVAAKVGFTEGDVWQTKGSAGVDSVCAERIAGPRGAETIAHVGVGGYMRALQGPQRREVAPTYYACGASFSKFLTARTDAPFMAALFRDMPRFETNLARRTGKTLATLRTEWLAQIGR